MSDTEGVVRIITEYFHPEEASTAQLMTELAVGLTDDFDVSVTTAYPNYHEEDTSKNAGKYSQYHGVDISRVRSTRFHKDRVPLRILNWITFTVLVFFRLLRDEAADISVVLSNPPILPFAAWAHKRLTGTPYAYVIYDMYPDMPVGLGVISGDGIVARLWEHGIRRVYRDADRIVVLGESMERRLDQKMADDPAFDSEKIEVIPNWEDGEFIEPVDKSENDFAAEQGTTDTFTLLYSGNIGRYHDVGTAIDAIEVLEARGRDDIQLLVIGEGGRKAGYRRRVESRGIENVRFLPFQPVEKLPETLTCGDASLVAIDEVMEGMCVSSKLYSSLAAGKPVLAVVGEDDEVARVVREHDCGAYARPGDADRVADILERWADDPERVDAVGENARNCFERNYTKDHAVSAYAELLASATR